MQADSLAPADYRSRKCQQVASQRRVLGNLVKRFVAIVPVGSTAVEIERVLSNLTGSPKEQWVVNVKRLADEGQQGGKGHAANDG